MTEIHNKVVIITEASRSLGKITPCRLAKGFEVMLAARREPHLSEVEAPYSLPLLLT